MKTIRITGIGNVTMEVNQIEINLTLTTLSKDYKTTINEHDEKLSNLMNLFLNCGFDKKDLKTNVFRVQPKYTSINTQKGYKQEFKGYEVYQALVIEFPLDMYLLDKILTKISLSNINPQLDINFTIKEKGELQNKLLESACKDAKTKAEILATCTNQKILNIESIDYSFSTVNVYSKAKYKCSASFETCSFGENFTPSDINESIDVTFVFQVE